MSYTTAAAVVALFAWWVYYMDEKYGDKSVMGDNAEQLSATPLTAKQRAAQRKSWFVGEMMLEHPEMTRAEAERLYYEAVGKE